MVYDLADLPPLETRVMRSYWHMIDKEVNGSHNFMLEGKANTFLVQIGPEVTIISPPFEDELKEQLEFMIAHLPKSLDPFYFASYRPESVEGIKELTLEPGSLLKHVYQRPMPPEAYQKRLEEFKDSGMFFRELHKEDIRQLSILISKWYFKKLQRIGKEFQKLTKNRPSSPEEFHKVCAELEAAHQDIKLLKESLKKRSYYNAKMDESLTHFYGVFMDGQLVAYLLTEGNNSFRSFTSRAMIRKYPLSPQEFLDLNVALDFASSGVPVFYRGVINHRRGVESLLSYKEKFGKLTMVEEGNYRLTRQK